ncbi:MAG: hypothetical protein HQ518_32600 [Rhodopirellula sp.]|nr:hypothetical protein [Rhodopirellula sp.]
MTRRPNRRATGAEQAQATHALLSALIDQGEASTDDAHRLYRLPDSCDQRTWGAIVSGLLTSRIIRRVGDRHTSRRIAHGRRIGRYVLADRGQAIAMRDRLAASAARQRARQLCLPGIAAK